MLKPKKIAANSVVSFGARIITTGLSLLVVGLLTRYLGKQGYGFYATVIFYLSVFAVLADFGLSQVALRQLSQPDLSQKEKELAFGNTLLVRFLTSLALFVLAGFFIWLWPYAFLIKQGIVLGCLGYWFLSLAQIFTPIFQKQLKMFWPSLAEISGRLAQVGLVFFLIRADKGFLPLIWAMVASCLVILVITAGSGYYLLRFKIRFNWLQAKELVRQGLPLAMAAILAMIYFRAGPLLLAAVKSAEQVAVFALSFRFYELAVVFPNVLAGLLLPYFAALKDKQALTELGQASFDKLKLLGLASFLGMAVLAKPVIGLVSGTEFLAAVSLLQAMALGLAVVFAAALFLHILIAIKKQRLLIRIYLVGAVFNLIFNIVLIPYLSAWAPTIAIIGTEFLVMFLLHRALKKQGIVLSWRFTALKNKASR